MVATAEFFADSDYFAEPGKGYDGVVLVQCGNVYGTGSLLYDGRAVLTAAHVVDDPSGPVTVTFETSAGKETVAVRKVLIHPAYDAWNSNNDLAILWLPQNAPITANRYDIYRDSDEIEQVFTFSGYGRVGSGSTGALYYNSFELRLRAWNRFDADAAALKNVLGPIMNWTPLPGTQLIADFDNGFFANDALGLFINEPDLGLGKIEGLIASGDSGEPAFIDGKVAGVASYVASLSYGWTHPDVDLYVNSSFGEIAAWQRVSAYQQWIDQSLRAQYPNAPTKPQEVKKEVLEGDRGTSYAYFLLQFTGERSDPEEWLSVDYATRNGTAMAGSDYIPVSGTLILYPGENQAVIPVEVIGDMKPEPDEYFYLDVFNPVGGSFGEGVVQLSAVRTIIDDDSWYG